MLMNLWYVAEWSKTVKDKPVKVKVLGQNLVLFRDSSGKIQCLADVCLHRGGSLGEGWVAGDNVVCPYHGWAYGLDGRLKNIPHRAGFPDFDAEANGLVAVPSREVNGLIYVCQDGVDDGEDAAASLDVIPNLIPDGYQLMTTEEVEVDANWKLYLESALEGYHIRSTHTQTFYPAQYDNLTVVEAFGDNSRVTYPYQTIERLRDRPQSEWSTNGRLTQVYHLFPNVVVSTFPNCLQVGVLEPLGVERTRRHTYLLGDIGQKDAARAEAMRKSILEGQEFAKTGNAEDVEVVVSAQRGLGSGANSHLTFGLFESAIGRLHAGLHRELG